MNVWVSSMSTLGVRGGYSPFPRVLWLAHLFSEPFGVSLLRYPTPRLSYKEVARSLGVECYRAVGSACGRNPLEIIVPCHRVVGSRGLGGYSAGLDAKVYLLRIEAESQKSVLNKV
ncbi:hypothetical protein B9Q04_15085 [Candidatus Marsarchaeota G2 archaeon BE_D]|uniref:Methylated-DNA-[protein]-cysteine S-methyltransferase DNA binding domain-containing protein n=1 Tax=Candidatus Marsarchaeota G2 archaeon BE_D TaxID=1978158 RepID=A0A2R6C6T8_9ARCH|nr:MAG: hypothetical protein B9Q04_15085 [Candidatus Marsarchaeota G2 archaeon BE_D]